MLRLARHPWVAAHRLADRLDRRWRRLVRAWPAGERWWVGLLDAIVARQPDRSYLRRLILPALARDPLRRVLFVGVRAYTRRYGEEFRRLAGGGFFTIDSDPGAARWGEPGRHASGDVRRLDTHYPAGSFDAVVMNGVFGWGVDDRPDMDRAIEAIHAVLAPGGLLLVGWNTDRSHDPDTLDAVARLFAPTAVHGLPARHRVPGVTHVFAWYRRRP
jgi:SAM-dependent methyltransferase